jgi:hypothetical protein
VVDDAAQAPESDYIAYKVEARTPLTRGYRGRVGVASLHLTSCRLIVSLKCSHSAYGQGEMFRGSSAARPIGLIDRVERKRSEDWTFASKRSSMPQNNAECALVIGETCSESFEKAPHLSTKLCGSPALW